MTDSLSDLLRRSAEAARPPSIDVDLLVAEADRRTRRRKLGIALTASVVVVVALGGTLALAKARPDTQGPVGPGPSETPVDVRGARPLVYAEGRMVHVGDRVVEAEEDVAFVAPTDDGAVYQAALDHTLWFTDGRSTEVIGRSGFTAAPTEHRGVVVTAASGSLVAWVHDAGGDGGRYVEEIVVFDTSTGQEVARIPGLRGGEGGAEVVLGEDEVWYRDGTSIGTVFRRDLSSDRTTTLRQSDRDEHLRMSPRTFTATTDDGRRLLGPPTVALRGHRLVVSLQDDAGERPAPVTLSSGEPVRWLLPEGWVPPWPRGDEGTITVSQWLDDDHVTLFVDDGGGDLPAKEGDVLTCPVPTGTCRVEVPRSPSPYVAPYLG